MPPLYDYFCPACGKQIERQCRVADRHDQRCEFDGEPLTLKVSPVYGRMAGQVLKGGGPDRFTADVIGCRLDELPDGLRTEPRPK